MYVLHKFVNIVKIFRPLLKETAIIWIASELDLWIESVSDLKPPPIPPREPSLFSSIALSQSPLTLQSYTTYLLRSHHWSVRFQKKYLEFLKQEHWSILTLLIQNQVAVREKLFFTFQMHPFCESHECDVPRGNLHLLATLFIANFPFPC